MIVRMKEYVPPEALELIDKAAATANSEEETLFLVGGVVRDLLLERTCLDIDLVLEGSAIKLAEGLCHGSLVLETHPAFGTATLKSEGFSLDFVTARREKYAKPGALPLVEAGTISDDLSRRDFSINAMAIQLTGRERGRLLDPFGGRSDLEKRVIRVLHERSFIDDATRILRAVRYEQRLGFQMESKTESWLRRDAPMLSTVSGDRIRHELDRTFEEEKPELPLERAGMLGVWAGIHKSLPEDGWLGEPFKKARELVKSPPVSLYYALFLYRLDEKEASDILNRLSAPKSSTMIVLDTIGLKSLLIQIASPEIKRSHLYTQLRDFSPQAIVANLAAAGYPSAEENLRLYFDKLRFVRPKLRGTDLIQMGAKPGPIVGELLSKIHHAKLDGEITTRAQEVRLARTLLGQKPPMKTPRRRRRV